MSHARVQPWITGAPPILGPKDSLKRALAVLRNSGAPELLVVDQGLLVGMLNERDIWQHCPTSAIMLEDKQRDDLLDNFRVGGVMALHPPILTADMSLADAARLFAETGRRGLPVLNDGVPVGFLSETAFLQAAGLLLQDDSNNRTKGED